MQSLRQRYGLKRFIHVVIPGSPGREWVSEWGKGRKPVEGAGQGKWVSIPPGLWETVWKSQAFSTGAQKLGICLSAPPIPG